jgi:hypothetical protein
MGIELKENTKKMRDTSTGKKKAYLSPSASIYSEGGSAASRVSNTAKLIKNFFLHGEWVLYLEHTRLEFQL